MASRHNLPTEILSEIFVQALPPALDLEGRRAFQTIRSVSSRWRFISFSTPFLWSSLSVKRRDEDPLDSSHCTRLLGSWFSKSGPTTLLKLEYEDRTRRGTEQAAIESLIRRYQSRWRSLSLHLHNLSFLDVVVNLPPSEWTSMETLVLPYFDLTYPDAEASSKAFESLERITSLQHLLVRFPIEKHRRRYGHLHLRELSIKLEHNFTHEHSKFISSYRGLTKLTLYVSDWYALDISPGIHLALPSLLSFIYHSSELGILNHVTTPLLHHLEIRLKSPRKGGSKAEDDIFIRPLTPFLGSLKSFTINCHLDEWFLAQALPLLSAKMNLTRLTLDSWPFKLSNTLFPEEAEEDWCPRLQELVISIERGGTSQLKRLEALASVLKRRETFGLPKLEKLTIHRPCGDPQFPYDLFAGTHVRTLSVMIPM